MSYVSESLWETAFSGNEFELMFSGYVLWNETDSLNSALQSQKLKNPSLLHSMKEEDEILKALCEFELLIIICNVAALIVLQRMQVKVPVVGSETCPVFLVRFGKKEKKKQKKK